MNTEKITTLVNELLMKRFLINFAPGIILLYGLNKLVSIEIDSTLISVLIITSFAWCIGLIQETLFFNTNINNSNLNISDTRNLLIAKLGAAIFFCCLLVLLGLIIDVRDKDYFLWDWFIAIRNSGWIIKTGLIMGMGLILWLKFERKLKSESSKQIVDN